MKFHRLAPTETHLINHVAEWYFDEWSVPIETTVQRLTEQLQCDLLFHLVLMDENKIIAAGGLHFNAGLLKVHEEYRKFGPWVSMIYTDKNYRKRGFGKLMLDEIEKRSKENNYSTIYLYTNSAEELYRKNNWIVIDRLLYKGKDTVVMSKNI